MRIRPLTRPLLPSGRSLRAADGDTGPAPADRLVLGEGADLQHLEGGKLAELARRIPKVDLHRHLEGSIEPEVLIPIARKYGIPLPSYNVEELRPYLQVTGKDRTLLDFLKKFDTIGKVFTDCRVIEELTYHVVAQAYRDNVRYLELRFSPMYMAAAHGLDLDDVVKGVLRGVERASRDTRMKVGLIMIVERQMGVEPARVVEELAEKYRDQGVVALDLANDEVHYPPGPYAEVFQKARKAGLKITVHAGEAAGPENVRTSLEKLGADRIGHGVRTYQDALVEQMVRQAGVPLELCPTSNVQTGAVKSLEQHPLRRYYDEGIKVTVNTDDPGVSGITLSDEFVKIVRQFGFRLSDLERIVLNGVEAAFLPEAEKEDLARQITEGFDRVEEWLLRRPAAAGSPGPAGPGGLDELHSKSAGRGSCPPGVP